MELFNAAVAAAQPALRVPPFLPKNPKDQLIIIGAGKAGGAMAEAVEKVWPGPLDGLVITRYGHVRPTEHIEVVEARHPVPDEAGYGATKRIMEKIKGLSADDLVLCLISGGGSALLTMPAGDITLAEKQQVNEQLLACGAHIGEMNCVRKHLSAIKGGRLATAAYPARLVSLMISDVPGDDPATIASGPTVGDDTTREDALEIVHRYNLSLPESVLKHLASSDCESPFPNDERLTRVENHIIAAPSQSLEAAAEVAAKCGVEILSLGDQVEGEARDVGRTHGALALEKAAQCSTPVLILSGGECTVTIRGSGVGGPNTEYLMGLALALDGHPRIHAIACDTDGVDGARDNAGAIISPNTLKRAASAGMDTSAMLENNDAWHYFDALGDLVVSGPTHTNVNDLRAILVLPE
ncbi:MAG: glycerate kinase type-2 family protein [Hyphomicrobiales bacterium]